MSERPAADNVPPPAFFSSDAERQRAVEQQANHMTTSEATELAQAIADDIESSLSISHAMHGRSNAEIIAPHVAGLIAERDAARDACASAHSMLAGSDQLTSRMIEVYAKLSAIGCGPEWLKEQTK